MSTWTGICVSDSGASQAHARSAGDVAPRRNNASASGDRLERLRQQISECDRELIAILARRRSLVREVGEVKARAGIPVTDPRREAAVVRRAAEMARAAGLEEEPIRHLIWTIMSSAREEQYKPTEVKETPEGS